MRAETAGKKFESSTRPLPRFGWRPTQTHYYYLSILLVIATLAFNRFLLSPEWATSEAGERFIESVLPFYPALRGLKQNWAGYTPQLGVLFSSMFVSGPIHFLIGLAGSFALHEDEFKKVCEVPWRSFLLCLQFFS